jgi:hypothetical protein
MRCTFAYPIQLDEKGRIKLSYGMECDRDSIFSTIETRPGERVERPLYGTPDFVFEGLTDAISIPSRIEVALTDQISTVQKFEVAGTVFDAGILDMTIAYFVDGEPQSTALRVTL